MLSTKKDGIIYLLGALQRLISQPEVELPPEQETFIYDLLNVIHRFTEGYEEQKEAKRKEVNTG